MIMEPLEWGVSGVVVIILFVWWAVGTAVAGSENPPDREHEDKCAQCKKDKVYFESQPLWKQTLLAAWYAGNRIACAAKGC